MPRHPPCALHSLSHTPPTQPTHHHTHNNPTHHRPPHTTGKTDDAQGITCTQRQRAHQAGDAHSTQLQKTKNIDARVHYPDLKQQPHTHTRAHPPVNPAQAGNQATTPPPAPPSATPTHRHRNRRTTGDAPRRTQVTGLIPQNPNSVPPPVENPPGPHHWCRPSGPDTHTPGTRHPAPGPKGQEQGIRRAGACEPRTRKCR
jgi:hypothetical protein